MKFDKDVDYYKKALGNIKNKIIFVQIDGLNKEAFYSLAALSRAAHDLEADTHVSLSTSKERQGLQVLKKLWNLYIDYKAGKKNAKTDALKVFADFVTKKTKNKEFIDIFKGPSIFLKAGKKGFKGSLSLKYKHSWFRPYRWNTLVKTSKRILKQGYALKKERIGIGFSLLPAKKDMELPLKDYLDNFSIAFSFGTAAKKLGATVTLSSSTDRKSQLDKPVRTVDLMTTIKGCELSKDIDEPVFKLYKKFSKIMKIKLPLITAGFGIHGKGYYGRHFFGEEFGYPSPNKKTRWSSPGQLMLKDRYAPQAKYDTRDPMMRYAITETLPLDIYIETCNVNYKKIRKRSAKIRDIMNKCRYVKADGKEINGFKTDLKFNLYKGTIKREFTASDSDVTSLIDKENLKKTGEKTGSFANFPSGEAFVTPEKMDGTLLGDIVINVNRSMRIPKNNPIKLKFTEGTWRWIDGPKDIKSAMDKERREAKHRISLFEKNKSLPKEIIQIYQDNFDGIGEFAINTNPKAKLCDYLIVNEKIANMIHVALGMGFEPDRKTLYHWDIVIDAPKQEINILGIDEKGKEHWVMKKGKFVA